MSFTNEIKLKLAILIGILGIGVLVQLITNLYFDDTFSNPVYRLIQITTTTHVSAGTINSSTTS